MSFQSAKTFHHLLTLPCLLCLLLPGAARAQDTAGLLQWLAETETALNGVSNYTTLFHRVEWVDGKLTPEEVTFMKFQRPFKIYMRWINPSKGQESLYLEGANNNKILAHASGLTGLINVNLDPNSAQAMKDHRHPVTHAGILFLSRTISSNAQKALAAGDLVTGDHGEKTVYGRKAHEFEAILSKDKSKGYYCYRCVVDIDLETRMPIKTQIFDWDNRLVESYGYEQLKLNPGLTSKDFDSKNPDYHF